MAAVSRQLRWQHEKKAAGLCASCGAPSSPVSVLCELSADFVDDIVERWAKELAEKAGAPTEDEAEEFIHLNRVQLFVPGQHPVTNSAMHFRARIADVSGFAFGRLTVQK